MLARGLAPACRPGFAYLLTLTVVVVVALVAMTLGRGVATRLKARDAAGARAQCEQAALGMIRAVVNDFETARAEGRTPALLTVKPEGERIGDCVVMLVGRDPAGGKVVFGPVPEAGKINVNTAPAATLAALPGMTTALAAAIVDWRDGDDDPDPQGGAERNDGAYAGAPVPYAPRNSPLESLDELRLVRDMTGALYFGDDANQNGSADPGEDTDGDGALTPGLRDLLTLDSREPALAPDDTPKVNVNSSARAMRTLLEARLGTDRAAQLMSQLRPPSGPALTLSNRLDFLHALDLTDDEAEKLWPYLTGPEGRLGLVDAYACGEKTLAAVVGDSLARTIIAARPALPPASPLWLAKALGSEHCDSAGMVLTCGSYQFTLDVLAVRADGAGYARLLALVDASGPAARVVSIRPAQAQGWPLPWMTPENLRAKAQDGTPETLLANPPR